MIDFLLLKGAATSFRTREVIDKARDSPYLKAKDVRIERFHVLNQCFAALCSGDHTKTHSVPTLPFPIPVTYLVPPQNVHIAVRELLSIIRIAIGKHVPLKHREAHGTLSDHESRRGFAVGCCRRRRCLRLCTGI
jgi:hypothetical protein